MLRHSFTAPATDAQQVGLGNRHTSILLSVPLGSLEAVPDTKQTKTIGEHRCRTPTTSYMGSDDATSRKIVTDQAALVDL